VKSIADIIVKKRNLEKKRLQEEIQWIKILNGDNKKMFRTE